MTTPRATQARDELGLKARLPWDAPLMIWGSTRSLVEGKEPGYGAGCGGRGNFPLRRGVMFIAQSSDKLKSIYVIQPNDVPETFHLCLKAWRLVHKFQAKDENYIALRSQAAREFRESMNFHEATLICPATLESVATTAKAQRQLQHELDLNTAMWALWPDPESMEQSSTEDTPKELPRNISPTDKTRTINHTSHKLDQERDSILAINLEQKYEVLASNTTSPTPAT